MRVYLAARYERREEMNGYRGELEECGVEVSSRWVTGVHETDPTFSNTEEAAQFALEDLEDVEDADVLVWFGEEPTSMAKRGGRHVEFGYALGLCTPVVIVGPRENIFNYLPFVEQFDTWYEAKGALVEAAEAEENLLATLD